MKTIKFLSLLALATVLTFSCSNDDDNPDPVNEEEVITTLIATLTPSGGGQQVGLEYRDLDGDGPDAPVITISGPLAENTTYNGSLELFNATETPPEPIHTEIEEEDEEHQFFFSATNGIGTFAYADQDSNGNPVGLDFTLSTATAGSGNITIILRHEPVKDAAGVSDGDITNAGGETDISVTFTGVTVQ